MKDFEDAKRLNMKFEMFFPSGERVTFPCKQWIQICPQPSKRHAEVLEAAKVEESKVAVQRSELMDIYIDYIVSFLSGGGML